MQALFPVSVLLFAIIAVLSVNGAEQYLPSNTQMIRPTHVRKFFDFAASKIGKVSIFSILPAPNEPEASVKIEIMNNFVNWIVKEYQSNVATFTKASMESEDLELMAQNEGPPSDKHTVNVIVHWDAQPGDILQVRTHLRTSITQARGIFDLVPFAFMKLHTRPGTPCSLQIEVTRTNSITQPEPTTYFFDRLQTSRPAL